MYRENFMWFIVGILLCNFVYGLMIIFYRKYFSIKNVDNIDLTKCWQNKKLIEIYGRNNNKNPIIGTLIKASND